MCGMALFCVKKAIIFKDILILIKFAWLTQEYYENRCRNH